METIEDVALASGEQFYFDRGYSSTFDYMRMMIGAQGCGTVQAIGFSLSRPENFLIKINARGPGGWLFIAPGAYPQAQAPGGYLIYAGGPD